MTRVITSGYVSIDHIVQLATPACTGTTSIVVNPTCATPYFGGCSINIAVALARLGIETCPFVTMGADWEHSGFKQFLEEAGVALDGIDVDPSLPTSISYLLEDTEGNHITCFYPGAMHAEPAHTPPPDWYTGARLGVITVAPYAYNRAFYNGCKAASVPLAFGMKTDASAFPTPFLWELLCGSTLLFMNQAERSYIEETFKLPSITDLFERGCADKIVVTCGARGSQYFDADHEQGVYIPACHCPQIVDCTGGGDGYMAGFIFGYLQGLPTEACCQLGSTLSSFILEHPGCCTGAPTYTQLMERYQAFCPITSPKELA